MLRIILSGHYICPEYLDFVNVCYKITSKNLILFIIRILYILERINMLKYTSMHYSFSYLSSFQVMRPFCGVKAIRSRQKTSYVDPKFNYNYKQLSAFFFLKKGFFNCFQFFFKVLIVIFFLKSSR